MSGIRRKTVYNDISSQGVIIQPSLTNTEPVEKRKRKQVEKQAPTKEPIKEPEVVEVEAPLPKRTTSNFNKFLDTLKVYVTSQPSDNIDHILQMYLNAYNLEAQFDNLVTDLQGILSLPLEQTIIEIIKTYYDWTTGAMSVKIQQIPQLKIHYDTLIKVISKYTDKI